MKRSLLVLCTLLLSACGFHALHGQAYREKLTVDLSAIAITVAGNATSISNSLSSSSSSTVPRRYGELLKAEIQDRVNPANDASEKLFTLAITYSETDVSLFVRPDGTASRGNMVYNSTYTITRNADQKKVAGGSLSSTSSYNTSQTADYATYVSIEDARKRAVLDLAETYKLRLATLLPTLNNSEGLAVESTPDNIPVLQPARGL